MRGKVKDIEYLWQADPAFWGRHSCILFPIIGKLKNGEYKLGNKTYQIGQHGFVRDMPFEVIDQQAHSISMSLVSDENTYEIFPFHYEVVISYRLTGNTLQIEYAVKNTGQIVMPFSLGAHPAFNCPLDDSQARRNYSLLFDKSETAFSRCLDDQGLIDDRKKLVLDDENTLKLTDDLFDEDALIFQDLQSDNVSLIDRDGNKVWTFRFSGFPYLGVWSQVGVAPFICIEPWHGIADTADASGHLFEKEGIRTLAAGSTFSCIHSVTIH
jgi:galactose mutarotase-like enzyme